jgi:hypothetical protein
MRWNSSFLVLSVSCSKSLWYLDDHFFLKIGKLSSYYSTEYVVYPFSSHCFSFFYAMICRFGLLMMLQWLHMFWLYFLGYFPSHCLNVLTHLPCPQSLKVCLWLDPVVYLDYWSFHFQDFNLNFLFRIYLLNSFFILCNVFLTSFRYLFVLCLN